MLLHLLCSAWVAPTELTQSIATAACCHIVHCQHLVSVACRDQPIRTLWSPTCALVCLDFPCKLKISCEHFVPHSRAWKCHAALQACSMVVNMRPASALKFHYSDKKLCSICPCITWWPADCLRRQSNLVITSHYFSEGLECFVIIGSYIALASRPGCWS